MKIEVRLTEDRYGTFDDDEDPNKVVIIYDNFMKFIFCLLLLRFNARGIY